MNISKHICVLLTLIVSLSHFVVSYKCGLSGASHSRIVGGDYAKPHQFPWIVHFEANYVPINIPADGRYIIHSTNCGGSLIDSQWVVTAAHCVHTKAPFEGYKVNSTILLFGGQNLKNEDELKIVVPAQKIYVHPKYDNKTQLYDIALVKLQNALNFEQTGYKIAPICLPVSGEVISKTECQVAGWGDIATNTSGNGVLKMANVVLDSTPQCKQHWSQFDEDLELCSGDKSHSTCQGDSGGPLQCRNDNGQWVLQGITSFGDKQCEADVPSVYTKVLGLVAWINEIKSGDV